MITYFLIPALALALVLISAYAAWRWEWKAFIPAAVLVLIPFFLNSNLDQALSLPMPILLGLFGGITVKKNYSLTVYLVSATVVMGALLTGQYYYMKNHLNIDVLQQSRILMEKRMESTQIPADQRTQMSKDFKAFEKIMQDKIPFLSFLQALIFTALSFYAVKLFLVRFHRTDHKKGLELFRLNDYFIFILIAGLAAFLLIDGEKYPMIRLIGLNAGLIISLLYVVQAAGIIKFILMKRNFPRYFKWAMLLFLLLAGIQILPFILTLLAGLGALDLWADFRKLNTAEKPEL